MLRPYTYVASMLGTVLGLAMPSLAQQPEAVAVNVVGTVSTLPNYAKLEKPFFVERLPEVSWQRIKGSIKPANELNLEGTQLLRLLKQGVFDFAFILPNYVEDASAVIEGIGLAGVAKDIGMARGLAMAWLPEVRKIMREQHNAEVLSTFVLPEQGIYCRGDLKALEDLKGKKIRTQSAPQSDLATALGAAPVAMSFAGTFAALQQGVVDCAMTGAVSALNAKWHEVAGTLLRLPAGFTPGLLVVNAATWDKLDAGLKQLIADETKALDERSWQLAAAETETVIACLSGGSNCPKGAPGRLKLLAPGADDIAFRDKALSAAVLKEWARRCGKRCADRWTETVGSRYGLAASPE